MTRGVPKPADGLHALLPLIYVAWADGSLSRDEIERIRTRACESRSTSRPESLTLLESWLDPERPPTPSEMHALREEILRLSGEARNELPRPAPESGADRGPGALVRLGMEMTSGWESPEAIRMLESVEEALGVAGHEAVRDLFGPSVTGGEAGRPASDAPPLFDVHGMTRYLEGTHREVRRAVLKLLARDDFHFAGAIDPESYREGVLRALRILAEAGLGSHAFPERYGGRGDVGASLATFETLAYGDLSLLVKFGVHFGLFGGSVLQLGSEHHHRTYLPAVGALELPGAYAMTETGHGSNVREIETRAVYLPESRQFEIHTPHPDAQKDWIGNAARHGVVATVFAQLEVGGEDHGVHAFLVPIRGEGGRILPGVRIEDRGWKAGLNGVDNGTIRFDRVRVPRENLLNRFADVTPEGEYTSPIGSAGKRFFTMLGSLVAGRISIAAASVSAAKTGLAIAVRYSERRRQFGPAGLPEVPVLDYLTQQRLLLPRLAVTYGLHFAVRSLSETYVQRMDGDLREVEVLAAGLKAYASRHTVGTLQACREACGGQGYLAENRLGALKADTDVFTTFEGANVVLLQLVAKGLLSRYSEEMGDLKLWGIVRHLAERAGSRVAAVNPIVSRKSDEAHLRDPDFHLSAFLYREERLLASVARRLKARIDGGQDSFEAMNECQDHLVTLAEAHVERVILERFHEGVARAPSPGLSEVLRNLAELFALSRMEADAAWFLESGTMEAPKTRAIRRLVRTICGEIREQAGFLVDGFGIPDEVLRAPAGLRS